MNGKEKSAEREQARYLEFLRRAADRVDKWPDWMRGDRPHGVKGGGKAKSHRGEGSRSRSGT